MSFRSFAVVLVCSSCIHQQFFAQRVQLDSVCFNSTGQEYGLRKVGERLFVVSDSEPTAEGKILRDELSGRIYSDLFELKECKREKALLFSQEFGQDVSMNSSFHDGPVSSDQAGNVLFFTNNAFSAKNKLGIFVSTKDQNGAWSTPIAAPMNNPGFNVTHPAYDEENGQLFYVSDENGNYDLFVVAYQNSSWGKPVRLDLPNTESNELFPHVLNQQIYFSSDRPGGFGGLDLYYIANEEVVLMNEPFNSVHDDLAICFFSDSTGTFTSNRREGSDDDIFLFSIHTVVPVLIPEVPVDVAAVAQPLTSVVFAFDRSLISDDQKPFLDSLANEMLASPTSYLIVSGHTDNVGKESYNLVLSKRRADEVKKYLVQKGVDSRKIILEFYGFSKPIASNATAEGRAANRRVDFTILDERK